MEQDKWIETLYLQYSTDIFRFLLSMLHDWHKSEDLMQEVFLKVWQKHPKFRDDRAQRIWLFKVARNLAIDELRHKQREMPEIPEDIPQNDSRSQNSILSVTELLCMIDTLEEPNREIVRLKLLGQLSHREIAKMLHRSEHSVKKRYERSIYNLRKMFEEEKR
ncbi:MAG: RNA polymerase sigma factor [Clostridiales bacterium]|nr:RNA polymerase sigma factor [Clostridiales bacterium]